MNIDVKPLLEQIELRPVIWDKKLKNNRAKVEKAWVEISRKMKLPKTLLRKKWKYLRDQFRSECKKIPADKFLDPFLTVLDYERYTAWCFFKYMFFLKSQIRFRKLKRPIGNKSNQCDMQKEDNGDNDMDDDDDEEDLEKQDEEYRKNNTLKNAAAEENREDQDQQEQTFKGIFVTENAAAVPTTKVEDFEAQIAQTKIKTLPREIPSIGYQNSKDGEKRIQNDDEKHQRLQRLERKLENLMKLNMESTAVRSEIEVDEDKAFFQSLMPHIKTLTPAQKMLCCMDIQANIYKHVYAGEVDQGKKK